MYRQLLLSVALVLTSVVASAAQQPLQRLEDFFLDVQGLEGSFMQTVVDEEGELVQRSAGTFQLKRPGRFRWVYKEPFEQTIVADGERLWVYDKELEQVTVRRIDKVLGTTPIMLLSEQRPLRADFQISKTYTEDGLSWVILQPKGGDTQFRKVGFAVGEEGIQRMVLHDQFGQATRIRFLDLIVNPDLEPSRFRFEVPEGVDVMGERP